MTTLPPVIERKLLLWRRLNNRRRHGRWLGWGVTLLLLGHLSAATLDIFTPLSLFHLLSWQGFLVVAALALWWLPNLFAAGRGNPWITLARDMDQASPHDDHLIASSVEFLLHPPQGVSRWMVDRTVAAATQRMENLRPEPWLDWSAVKQVWKGNGALLLLFLALFLFPLTQASVLRSIAPWVNTSRPSSIGLKVITSDQVLASGSSITIEGVSSLPVEEVVAHLVWDSGLEERLTLQSHSSNVFSLELQQLSEGFRFDLRCSGDVTPLRQIRVLQPPRIIALNLTLNPPITSGLPKEKLFPGPLRCFRGSTIGIELQSLPQEGIVATLETPSGNLASTQQGALHQWQWHPKKRGDWSIVLSDPRGVQHREGPHPIQLQRDRTPRLQLSIQGRHSNAIGIDEELPLKCRIEDDLGLKRAALHYHNDRKDLMGSVSFDLEGTLRHHEEALILHPTLLGSLPGDVLHLFLEAEDVSGQSGRSRTLSIRVGEGDWLFGEQTAKDLQALEGELRSARRKVARELDRLSELELLTKADNFNTRQVAKLSLRKIQKAMDALGQKQNQFEKKILRHKQKLPDRVRLDGLMNKSKDLFERTNARREGLQTLLDQGGKPEVGTLREKATELRKELGALEKEHAQMKHLLRSRQQQESSCQLAEKLAEEVDFWKGSNENPHEPPTTLVAELSQHLHALDRNSERLGKLADQLDRSDLERQQRQMEDELHHLHRKENPLQLQAMNDLAQRQKKLHDQALQAMEKQLEGPLRAIEETTPLQRVEGQLENLKDRWHHLARRKFPKEELEAWRDDLAMAAQRSRNAQPQHSEQKPSQEQSQRYRQSRSKLLEGSVEKGFEHLLNASDPNKGLDSKAMDRQIKTLQGFVKKASALEKAEAREHMLEALSQPSTTEAQKRELVAAALDTLDDDKGRKALRSHNPEDLNSWLKDQEKRSQAAEEAMGKLSSRELQKIGESLVKNGEKLIPESATLDLLPARLKAIEKKERLEGRDANADLLAKSRELMDSNQSMGQRKKGEALVALARDLQKLEKTKKSPPPMPQEDSSHEEEQLWELAKALDEAARNRDERESMLQKLQEQGGHLAKVPPPHSTTTPPDPIAPLLRAMEAAAQKEAQDQEQWQAQQSPEATGSLAPPSPRETQPNAAPQPKALLDAAEAKQGEVDQQMAKLKSGLKKAEKPLRAMADVEKKLSRQRQNHSKEKSESKRKSLQDEIQALEKKRKTLAAQQARDWQALKALEENLKEDMAQLDQQRMQALEALSQASQSSTDPTKAPIESPQTQAPLAADKRGTPHGDQSSPQESSPEKGDALALNTPQNPKDDLKTIAKKNPEPKANPSPPQPSPPQPSPVADEKPAVQGKPSGHPQEKGQLEKKHESDSSPLEDQSKEKKSAGSSKNGTKKDQPKKVEPKQKSDLQEEEHQKNDSQDGKNRPIAKSEKTQGPNQEPTREEKTLSKEERAKAHQRLAELQKKARKNREDMLKQNRPLAQLAQQVGTKDKPSSQQASKPRSPAQEAREKAQELLAKARKENPDNPTKSHPTPSSHQPSEAKAPRASTPSLLESAQKNKEMAESMERNQQRKDRLMAELAKRELEREPTPTLVPQQKEAEDALKRVESHLREMNRDLQRKIIPGGETEQRFQARDQLAQMELERAQRALDQARSNDARSKARQHQLQQDLRKGIQKLDDLARQQPSQPKANQRRDKLMALAQGAEEKAKVDLLNQAKARASKEPQLPERHRALPPGFTPAPSELPLALTEPGEAATALASAPAPTRHGAALTPSTEAQHQNGNNRADGQSHPSNPAPQPATASTASPSPQGPSLAQAKPEVSQGMPSSPTTHQSPSTSALSQRDNSPLSSASQTPASAASPHVSPSSPPGMNPSSPLPSSAMAAPSTAPPGATPGAPTAPNSPSLASPASGAPSPSSSLASSPGSPPTTAPGGSPSTAPSPSNSPPSAADQASPSPSPMANPTEAAAAQALEKVQGREDSPRAWRDAAKAVAQAALAQHAQNKASSQAPSTPTQEGEISNTPSPSSSPSSTASSASSASASASSAAASASSAAIASTPGAGAPGGGNGGEAKDAETEPVAWGQRRQSEWARLKEERDGRLDRTRSSSFSAENERYIQAYLKRLQEVQP